MVFTASLLGAQQNRDSVGTSRQACLLHSWAKHLKGGFHLYVADRWWGQQTTPRSGPSLTEDSQTDRER